MTSSEDGRRQLASDMQALEGHYNKLIATHASSPAGAQWSDRETQERRMTILAEVGDLRAAKVLDWGCGTGHMLSVLRSRFSFDGSYVGYDLAESALALGRATHPEARFDRRDVLTDGVAEDFDYVFVSGVFNNRISDNWTFLTHALVRLYERTRRALAFNLLSTYVDRFDPGLAYFDPGHVFRFCKEELSPKVILRHEYEVKVGVVPFEFTIYVHRTSIPCRANLAPSESRCCLSHNS